MDFFPAAGSKLEAMKGTTLVLVCFDHKNVIPHIVYKCIHLYNGRHGAGAALLEIEELLYHLADRVVIPTTS